MRDSQRSRVYKAEWCLNFLEPPMWKFKNIEEARARLDEVLRSATFRRRYPWIDRVELFLGRSCYQLFGTITLARWGLNDASLLHELAHAILWVRNRRSQPADYSPHGWEFCTVLTDLVEHWMGAAAADKLREAFRAKKVRTRPRRTLNLTDEQRQVRRQQFAERIAARRVQS
jgi:predicted SprT family Zn-dependent metalloprotease